MKEKMSLYNFYGAASALASHNRLRLGQAMFNHLHSVRPNLALQVQGTDKDPYHCNELHPNWNRFIEFLEANW